MLAVRESVKYVRISGHFLVSYLTFAVHTRPSILFVFLLEWPAQFDLDSVAAFSSLKEIVAVAQTSFRRDFALT